MKDVGKRLFVVTLPFTAQHASGGKRMFKASEELFAPYPVQEHAGIVTFAQDNEEFAANAKTFLASTRLKNPVEEFLDQASIGGPGSPPKCKTCGHQKLEHKNGQDACRAMNVVDRRQLPCSCQRFEPFASENRAV